MYLPKFSANKTAVKHNWIAACVINIRITASRLQVELSTTSTTNTRLVYYTSVRNILNYPTRYPDILPRSRTTPYRPPANSTHSQFVDAPCYDDRNPAHCPYVTERHSQMESCIHESDTFSSAITSFKGAWHHRNTTEGSLTSVLLI